MRRRVRRRSTITTRPNRSHVDVSARAHECMSEYEQQRSANIVRNEAMLRRLGLLALEGLSSILGITNNPDQGDVTAVVVFVAVMVVGVVADAGLSPTSA